MPKYEELAGKVFWAIGTLFVVVLVIGMASSLFGNHPPDSLTPRTTKHAAYFDRYTLPIPFPESWTAYPITLDQAQEMREMDLKRRIAVIEKIAQKHPEIVAESQVFLRKSDQKFLNFSRQMQPGDGLWYFSTPKACWKDLCGRAGFVIVRNGKEVDRYTTLMN